MTLFGVLHHDAVRRSLLHEIDRTLLNRSNEVKQVLVSQEISSEEEFVDFQPISSSLELTSAPEIYVEITTLDDEPLWKSENLSGKSMKIPDQAMAVGYRYGTITQADGLRLRYLCKRVRLVDGLPVLLTTAESLSHMETAMSASIRRTVLLGVLILVLTELVGNLAFRGVFYPLRRLVATTEEIIATGDVSRRVTVFENADPQILRTAQAYNLLLERVEQLLKMAHRLLADTSHELRNPLTVLMTDLDLLREDLTPEQKEEVISEAQFTVRRLNRLVSDLLLLSRTEATPENLLMEEVEVEQFLREVADRFSRSQGRPSVVIGKMPAEVIGFFNRERTEQILTNLFENGVRYSQSQEVEVEVFADQSELIVSVKDDGCGIESHEHEKIFHRFYRVDQSRNRDSGGTGLGLAVARALARLQGGDITVNSSVGAGAEFRVALPLALVQSPAT
ncbi:MAG: HAMP domain-containing sensor histidine kinase [Vulcanimicrobiota bacterium]